MQYALQIKDDCRSMDADKQQLFQNIGSRVAEPFSYSRAATSSGGTLQICGLLVGPSGVAMPPSASMET